jgi:hypothetical protein
VVVNGVPKKTAAIVFPIKGPKAEAVMSVVAHKDNGPWVYEIMEVQGQAGQKITIMRNEGIKMDDLKMDIKIEPKINP